MDYLEYWSLRRQPFLAETDDLFFAGASQREAIAGLSYFVAGGCGTARLVAPRRCGMTRLLRHVCQMQGLGDCAVDTILSDGKNLRRDCLGKELVNGLGVPAERDGSDALLARMLQSSADQGVRTVWLIDRCNAEAAMSIEVWAQDFPMLSVVIGSRRSAISGGRLVLRSDWMQVDLDALSLEDTFEYLNFCLRQAGAPTSLFLDSAAVRLHEITGGAIADLARAAEASLRLAAARGLKDVEPTVVEKAVEQRRAA